MDFDVLEIRAVHVTDRAHERPPFYRPEASIQSLPYCDFSSSFARLIFNQSFVELPRNHSNIDRSVHDAACFSAHIGSSGLHIVRPRRVSQHVYLKSKRPLQGHDAIRKPSDGLVSAGMVL